jgi:isocitrate dehydrogenase
MRPTTTPFRFAATAVSRRQTCGFATRCPVSTSLTATTRPLSTAYRRANTQTFAPATAITASWKAGQVRRMATEGSKIKVKNPVVELDGDEMTRIIWQDIKDRVGALLELEMLHLC